MQERMAWILSLGGVIPMAGLAVAVWCALPLPVSSVLPAYAALLLSFHGGIQWGAAMEDGGDSHRAAWIMAISAFPPLLAWLALWQDDARYSLGVTLAGMLAALLVDRSLVAMKLLPAWFLRLRLRVTLLHALCLLAALPAL